MSRFILLVVLGVSASSDRPVLSCSIDSICFSGHFNDNGVMQRGPGHSAYYGSVPLASPANAPISLTISAADGSYNKTFSSIVNEDRTWKVILGDPMQEGGNYTAFVSCPTCPGNTTQQQATLFNQTFGDVYHCSGQSNACE